MHLVCPDCGTVNRVPDERIKDNPVCGRCKLPLFKGEPIARGDGNLETFLAGSEFPMVVDFWAEWCGPCRMIAPSVEAVAEEYVGKASFFKMNVDENMNVPQRYGIRGIPTLILFKGGQEQERIVGAVSRDAIAKVVGKYVEPVVG